MAIIWAARIAALAELSMATVATGTPVGIWTIDSKLTLKSIWSDHGRHADEMARLLIAANGLDSMILHDPGNSLAADLLSRFTQVKEDSRTSVDPTARRIRLLDEFEQSFVFNRSIRQRPMDPSVEATSGDFEDPTHRLH